MNEPIIVTGMHRSGTSLVSRILAELGVFMGWRQELNAESRAFISLNKWLLEQAGANWDHPAPVDYLLSESRSREIATGFCGTALTGRTGVSYLGPARWLRYRTPANLRRPWGWKDPRSTLTLPIWLDLFPKARVIHVLRNGLDVSLSLMHRQQQRLDRAPARLSAWTWRASKRVLDVARFSRIEDAMSLWCDYVERGRMGLDMVAERGLEVRYEDLLRQPDVELARLSRWLGLAHTMPQLEALTGVIDPTRAEAWRRDRKVCAQAPRFADMLLDYGYLVE